MALVGTVFLWVWVVLIGGLSLYVVLLYWTPVGSISTLSVGGRTAVTGESEDSWWGLAAMKLGALGALALVYLLIDGLLPGDRPALLDRLAQTVLFTEVAVALIAGGIGLVAHHRTLLELADEPANADLGDLAQDAVSLTPLATVRSLAIQQATRWLLWIPMAWLLLALVPLAAGTVVGLAVVSLWTGWSSPFEHAGPVSAESAASAWAVVEHVAVYAYWGGVLVASLWTAWHHRTRTVVTSELATAGVAATALVIFVVLTGIWP